MKVKSTEALRYFIKTQKGGDFDRRTDSDFIGSYHGSPAKGVKGFFKIYHGIKEDISSYLQSILKIAEDGQAVYEFIQNAVDCNSSQFWIFYNDDYFLAINNGESFKLNEIASILNIAQSDKRNLDDEERCDKIGRFGIGFKLVHRLVGENDGSNELTKINNGELKGPVLFSWSHYSQLKSFLVSNDVFEQVKFNKDVPEEYHKSPWLFKILLTNFPASPGEVVKDFYYQPFTPLPISEINEFKDYLKSCLGETLNNGTLLSKGSMFFIKLGKGKAERLRKESVQLEAGVNYSMHFFNKLQKITINDIAITKKPMEWLSYEIKKTDQEFIDIDPEYSFCPIKISVGFTKENKRILLIKEQPNFYKYFPLGDETNKLGLILHSDAFDIESNRRKLHNSTRNEKLINTITNRVIKTLDSAITSKDEKYKFIFLSILLSEANQSESKANTLGFIIPLKDFIKSNVVTYSGTTKSEHVKIKAFKYPIELKDIGFENYQWFAWDDISFKEACDSAHSELGIERWGLRHLISNSESHNIATYLKSLKQDEYIKFIEELKSEDLIKSLKDKLIQASWLLTQNGNLVSIQNIVAGEAFLINDISKEGAYIFQKISKQVISSELNFAYSYIIDVGGLIETTTLDIIDFLSQEESSTLITTLTIQERIYLNNIVNKNDEAVCFVPLFRSIKKGGSLKPLNSLISNSCKELPTWLNDFVIDSDEETALSTNFQAQLLEEKDLLAKLFCNSETYSEIITGINTDNVEEFYEYLLKLHEGKTDDFDIDKTIPWVYIEADLTFAKDSDVYLPDSFTKLPKTKYASVKTVIETISDEKLPHFSALQIKVPFALGGNKFQLTEITPKEDLLEISTVNDFLDWAEANGEHDLLNHLSFTKVGDKFSIGRVDGTVAYYTTDLGLIQLIEASNLNSKLTLFPSELYTKERSKIGLLEVVSLLKYLLDAGYASIDLAKYIQSSNDPKLSFQFFENLVELNINTSKTYIPDDDEFRILKLAIQYIVPDKDKLKSFKNKITIDGQPLLERAISEDVYFYDKNVGLKTKLSDILPAYKNRTFPLSEIIGKFDGFDDNKNLVAILKDEGRTPKKILQELNELNPAYYDSAQTLFLSYYQSLYPEESVLKDKIFLAVDPETNRDAFDKEVGKFFDYCVLEDNYFGFVEQGIIDSFNPLSLITHDHYATESERLPYWLKTWLNGEHDEKKKLLIERIKINGEDSHVVQLRKGLSGDNSVNMDAARGGINAPELLKNTFEWLMKEYPDKVYNSTTLKPLYERANVLNIPISEIPLPLPLNIEGNSYTLHKPSEAAEFHLIWSGWGNYKKEIWEFLKNKNCLILDNVLPEKYLEKLDPLKSEVETKINSVELKKGLRDFNAWFYKHWEGKDNCIIKIYRGDKLPQIVVYNNQTIKTFNDGLSEKIDGEYIVAESIESSIPHSIKELIPEFFHELNSWKSDFENNRTERKLTPQEEEAIMKLFDGVVPEELRKNQNLTALASALIYLEENNYDVNQANKALIDTHDYAQLTPVYNKNGEKFTVMCRSARLGLLYLTKQAWDRLDQPDVMLFADRGYDDPELFKTKQEVLDINIDNPTDFQLMRIESRANAQDLDQMLKGNFEDASRLWIILRLKGNEHFDKLFFERPETNNTTFNTAKVKSDDDGGY
jgi:hypothetical protein